MVEPAMFRDVLAQWPSGVTVVTTVVDGSWHGMTASSFSSVSLDPPLVSICLDRRLYTHGLIQESGVFGVSVLAKDQADVARRFAGMAGEVSERFLGETWSVAGTGTPLLDSALGWVDCRVVHEHPGGDHTIFVGEVVAAHTARRTAPLLFHSRGWGQFADVLPDVATLSDGGLVSTLTSRGENDAWVTRTSKRVRESGVRVRVMDLTGDPARDSGRRARRLDDGHNTSALVGSAAAASEAVGRGVRTVEVYADPADARSVESAVAALSAHPTVGAVVIPDAFHHERLEAVLAAVEAFAALGISEISFQDTLGSATPLEVRATLQEAVGLARPVPLRVALHDADRLGLVKALTALKSGVHHFDTTLGGVDGAVATEDLVRLLGAVDVETPVDAPAITRLARRVRQRLDATPDLPRQVADRDPAQPDSTPSPRLADTVGAAG
ncbi:flavin reductase [Nocardioides cavernae]|uniref:Flavin reductase n=1 Tax=Nocardioides cavernae TaxID=1921566 RepID=A0ABR8NF24_9ACTN|nr:flavin reductase [Nocardioides cavernae]MBD3926727.1 flavin reductase [Nocardioides cavernae]MBM7512449.1 flavin reductase (DIM6/NTAB) family NADH-FMN oxidoreductase RutF [Nocardioides cavernae]